MTSALLELTGVLLLTGALYLLLGWAGALVALGTAALVVGLLLDRPPKE